MSTMEERIEKPCVAGCGQTVSVVKTPLMSEGRFAWLADSDLLCEQCADEAEQRDLEREEREREERRQLARVEESGVPNLLQSVTWGQVDHNLDRAGAIDAAQRWGRGELRGLTLFGPVGVGKSWIAAAATMERLRRERVRWYSVPALIAHALSDFTSADRRKATETLTGDIALVLDDIDKVKATEWVASQLFVAIDARVQNDAPFIVTTNLAPGDFAGMFGEAIADRLFGGDAEVHEVGGLSRR